MKKVNNDILDPGVRMPIVLVDGFTVRFPAHWSKKDRDEWRRTGIRENYLKERGKD